MLRSMRAVVTPQEVINGCLSAAQATKLGRNTLLDMPLSLIDHFGFCVEPDDYPTVSTELHDMLDRICVSQLSIGGEVTMGLQIQSENALSWSHGNPLPGLAIVSSQGLPLHAGGGYVALHADMMTAYHWLQQRDVGFHFTDLYGIDVIWVPLHTSDYGVGDGYYALCVTSESLFQTTSRLTA